MPSGDAKNGDSAGVSSASGVDVEELFRALREEVRRSGGDPGVRTGDVSDRRAARAEAERLWPVSADRSLRLRPGFRGGIGTPVKAVLRKLPILGRGFDVVGFVPIERENRERATQAIDVAVASVRSGNSLLMFPEGTRSRTGALLPFKKGAFVLAIKAQAPIVPTAIFGAARAMRPGSPLIWPTTVRVHFAAPVETDGLGIGDRDALTEQVRTIVAHLLDDAARADALTTVPAGR